ncbi:MAG: GNAT family N-acetyltransferase [Anaerolineales bacterium]|nr:GNAT family N-acetyltransferase [Anaerolineales bacterium]
MYSFSASATKAHWPHLRVQQTAVSIRHATLADAHTIIEMGIRLIPAAHTGALPAADMDIYLQKSFSLAQVQAELCQPVPRFFLAEVGQRIAGMVKLHPTAAPLPGLGQRPLELSRLYLNPDWIGKGVGSALMQHALRQAAQHDICWLMVWTGNQRALAFYRRWQFTIAGTVTYAVGQSSLPAHIMIHKIPA